MQDDQADVDRQCWAYSALRCELRAHAKEPTFKYSTNVLAGIDYSGSIHVLVSTFFFRNDVYDLKFTLIRYNYINIVYGIIELALIIILIFLCASFLKQIANELLLSIFKMYVCVCTWVCKAHLKLYHLYMCVTYFMWRIKFNSHARHRIVLYGCLQMHIWYMVSNWKVFGLNAYNSTICTYVFKIASVRVRIYAWVVYA